MKKSLTVILILLSSISFAQAKTLEQSPRFLVHLLDYLAKDYGGAVADGKVLSQSEYHEQKEFAKSAIETNAVIDETKGSPEIQKNIENLNRLINAKANADDVAKLARLIQTQVLQVSKLEVAPARWPSISRGKQIFSQNCVACHGATGIGDGPAGISLNPKPANFLDSHMKEISPFQAFNTIRLGVPGTGMPPFHSLADKEVWDVAVYVIGLRHEQKKNLPSDTSSRWNAEILNKVATSSDEKLETLDGDKKDSEKTLLISALRNHSDDDESGGGSLKLARAQLDEALDDYKNGNIESSRMKALKAYLEGIEPIEPRLKATDPSAVSALEEKMALVRGSIEARKPLSEIISNVFNAKAEIDKAEQLITTKEMSPWVAFIAASAIIFREGFEAVLLIIALLGVIRAAGSKKAALWVHGGWISALGVGAIAWFFSGWLLGISGAQRETLEGTTSLFAVTVLLFVGFWLHSQTEIGRWKAFIHGKVQRALDGKNLFALASISFIAVFREAFETVLFLRAIWFEGGDSAKVAMTSGVFASVALVIGMGWAILKYSTNLPIRRLFEISAMMMVALAFILTGKGMHSFQETGVLTVTSFPLPFHLDILGLYPTWETLISQLVIFALIYGLWAYGKKPSTASK